MKREMAEELIKAINCRGAAPPPKIGQRIERHGTDDIVVTKYGRYREVPERLPITDHPCSCEMRYCGSGKVAPSLLDYVREGNKVDEVDAPIRR